jgi:hypothetical protein
MTVYLIGNVDKLMMKLTPSTARFLRSLPGRFVAPCAKHQPKDQECGSEVQSSLRSHFT